LKKSKTGGGRAVIATACNSRCGENPQLEKEKITYVENATVVVADKTLVLCFHSFFNFL
jgi:hypothetical protein